MEDTNGREFIVEAKVNGQMHRYLFRPPKPQMV